MNDSKILKDRLFTQKDTIKKDDFVSYLIVFCSYERSATVMEASCVICYRPITRTTVYLLPPTHNSEIDPPPLFSLLLLSLHRSLVEATCHLSDLLESVFVVCVADLQLLDAHLHDSFQ